MKNNSAIVLYAIVLAVSFVPINVLAQTTVFDNFGAGDSYQLLTGATLSEGNPIGNDFDAAYSFTPLVGGMLSDIWLAAGLSEGPNILDVALMSSSSGEPGAILESFVFNGAMGVFGDNSLPLHGVASGTTELVAGTEYWLFASAPGPDVFAVWNASVLSEVGGWASRSNGGAWNINTSTQGAFRVEISSVPVPGALFLFLSAFIGFGPVLCKRKKASS